MILIASVYIKDKNYYPQVFLEKCENVAREKKTSNFITDDIEIYSDDSDEKIQMKKKVMRITSFFKGWDYKSPS